MAEKVRIRFYNDGCNYRLRERRRVARWIAETVVSENQLPGEISFIFCSPDRHIAINRQYLGHDYHTDVITFDYKEETGDISGDIFIDPVTVRMNATAYGATAREEMLRVLIHGVLHLCGYGDKTESEAAIMRRKEDQYLEKLHSPKTPSS